MPGVLKVAAPHDMIYELESAVTKAITGCKYPFLDMSGSVHRVLWWHHFYFGSPVTIVLACPEDSTKAHAVAIHNKASDLVRKHTHLHVIIDGAIDAQALVSGVHSHDDVVEVRPLMRAALEQQPDLLTLIAALKTVGLNDVVWACVGGCPGTYHNLQSQWESTVQCDETRGASDPTVRSARRSALLRANATVLVQGLVARALEMKSAAPRAEVEITRPPQEDGGGWPYDDSMRSTYDASFTLLRVATKLTEPPGLEGSGQRKLYPISHAMAFVFRHKLRGATPSIDALCALARAEQAVVVHVDEKVGGAL